MRLQSLVFADQPFTVCSVDLSRESLCLFWKDDSGAPFRRFSALNRWLHQRERKLLFAMNAGMYERDLSPVGLYVEDGRLLRPLNARGGRGNFYLKPNGVFAITADGAMIRETSGFSVVDRKTMRWATQSGPLLVQGGRLHPAFRAGSANRYIRNGVGVTSTKQVVFALSERPVNFYDFARLFRDHLRCADALYLDGFVSSLYALPDRRADNPRDLGPMFAIATGA